MPTSLANSLYGSPSFPKLVRAFLVDGNMICAHQQPDHLEAAGRIHPTGTENHLQTMVEWVATFGSNYLINDVLARTQVTSDNLVRVLNRAGIGRTCNIVYISGCAIRNFANDSLTYSTTSDTSEHPIDHPHGINTDYMRTTLLARDSLILPNILLDLPHVLVFEPDGIPVWRDAIPLNGPGGATWDRPQTIVHFACITSRTEGSLSAYYDGQFTREFCSISANESISLAEHVKQIQRSLHSATERAVVHVSLVPTLYACAVTHDLYWIAIFFSPIGRHT
ncbi:hypothetical protein B0J17DRAFT_711387 [Rhizoctonia solani]|nr:hypothetical protein B0J17DRAFT_711387 [Rhizoctonia solani]